MPDPSALITTLQELVAIPSIGGTPAEAAIQHHLAERLAALGLEVDLWPIDLAELRSRSDYPGEEVERVEAWGLVGVHRPDERSAMVLQGHVDVVPIGELTAWTSDPFLPVVRHGRIIGRGACDMKGGVAAILAAVEAVLSDANEPPPFRGALRRRRGRRWARRVRHPGSRPHRRRLHHPRADKSCA